MKSSPYLHAFAAALYITLVAVFVRYMSTLHHDTPDRLIDSVAAISLVTFSAAVMAFLFFYKPVALLIEHKTQEALSFFLKTLTTFGAIALLTILFII